MKHYCLVGVGSRGLSMFAQDLQKTYADVARLTGIMDINPGRVQYGQQVLGDEVAGFTDFDEMLDSVPCDVVIVTTKDATHRDYIVRALERGKDVITEKPMTTTAESCRAILSAEQRTGHSVRVTFNYRYAPYKTEIKRIIKSGVLGELHSVEFRWFLDTVHGADYFRRWHAHKENSGGLLVHKATHHFDLINWWLDLEPVEVAAMGARKYYVPERMPNHGERCSACSVSDECAFYLDLDADDKLRSLYRLNEHYDGYYRDGCVFSPDIDIEDTMSVIVRYPGHVQLTYGLTAATSFEGWQVAFNGSKGRLEAFEPEWYITEKDQHSFKRRSDKGIRQPADWRLSLPEQPKPLDELDIRFYPLFGGVERWTVPHVGEGHGGGDRRLRDDLFRGVNDDPLGHAAGSRAGAMSVLIGVAANESIRTGQFIRIDDLLKD
ncbi:Gfo/Idh/MocA family oxidoreductase [Sulfobacillus sp. DSM 109850]|uniref:Gfo/Idh/MocA family oxidoreductase n=1 Tax=Sulfobacillus harzensis TaxID=2729629 RepID=A0A7Y0Q3V3_9FIRM|nr:Gfo/Idh/MocA family oxidoreductase [Sulfobacillus harzensis]